MRRGTLAALVAALLLTAVWAEAQPAISVSPSSVTIGTPVTATWSGIASPTATDWIGTYTPAAANTAFQANWVYVNCTQTPTVSVAAGTCSIATTGLAAGTYQLRLLANDSFTSLATSANFTVTAVGGGGTQRYVGTAGTGGTNNCTDPLSPCHFLRAAAVAVCRDTINIQDGDYTGTNQMMNFDPNFGGTAPLTKTCALGTEITVRAINEGSAFFDGQFLRNPLNTYQMSFWKFIGLDFGNSSDGTGTLRDSDNITVQRSCFSNIQNTNPGINGDVVLLWNTTNSLLEDVCAFGVGRNTMKEYAGGGTNTFRRIWMRHEGLYTVSAGVGSGTPVYQLGYQVDQNSVFENVISILDTRQQMTTDTTCVGTCTGALLTRDTTPAGATGYQIRGWIAYEGDNSRIPLNGHHVHINNSTVIAITDMFIDATAAPATAPGLLTANSATVNLSRVTVIKTSGTPASTTTGATVSNFKECNSLGACPDFYTGAPGSSGGNGARNCFEYTNGVLGSVAATQGLWPWRMDNRIKNALERARNAGTGGGALAGVAGTGYAANTVTSEIVSRYGAIPAGCLRSTPAGVPPIAPSGLRIAGESPDIIPVLYDVLP